MFGGRIGPMELVLILVILLVIFGPSKLPELGRSLGRGIKEFKGATKDVTDGLKKAVEDEPKAAEEEKKA